MKIYYITSNKQLATKMRIYRTDTVYPLKDI